MTGTVERYPFPIAHSGQRMAISRTAAERLERAGHAIEMTAVTLGIFALGWCRSRGKADNAVEVWEKAVARRGAALGGWVTLLGSVRPVMAASPADPLAKAIGQAIEAVLPRLRGYTPTRNQYSHGGRPRISTEEETAAADLAHRALTVMDSIESIAGVRLGVVKACTARRDRHDVDLDVFTGHAELPTIERLPSVRPLRPGVAVAYGRGSLDFAAELAPFCIYHACPTCGHDELFYLTKRTNKRADHFAFASGHKLQLSRERVVKTTPSLPSLGLQPLGAKRIRAAHGWRGTWSELAPRPRRLVARFVDFVIVLALGLIVGTLSSLAGSPTVWCVVAGAVAALAYEPIAAWFGGTVGKRLLAIDVVSILDYRPLGRADSIQRALLVDLSMLLFPLAIRSMTWVLWDPARQPLHDRQAASMVVSGRSKNSYKR